MRRRDLPRIADALRAAADLCITHPQRYGHAVSEGAAAFGVDAYAVWDAVDETLGADHPWRWTLHDNAEHKARVLLEVAALIEERVR